MRTFIINMRKDVRRKKDMILQLDRLAIDHDFFEGVDGKSISQEKLAGIADIKKLEDKEKRPISELKGLVGCTYSHFLIYQKMVDEDIPMACVLEDDVILSSTFKNQLDWLESEIQENEIVSLHTLLYDPVHFQSTARVNELGGICTPTPPKIRGTQGYVITLHCARQLIQEMMPIKDFPDCFNRYHLFCPDVQIRVLFPFIIRHMWIDSVRDDKKHGIKDQAMNFVQKHRVFPFWNMIRTRRRRVNDTYISSFITTNEKVSNFMYVEDLRENNFLSPL